MITLTPTAEEFPSVARVLFDLSDDVNHVASTSDTPSLGLVIPDYLHARYVKYLDLNSSSPIEPKKRSRK